MKTIIGIDLGDKFHRYCVLDPNGEVLAEESLPNTRPCLEELCDRFPGALMVMEAGTHSPWISRVVDASGCEAFVVNPRNLRAIWASQNKNDQADARKLALLYRGEPRLLPRVVHRGEQAQVDLAVLRSRTVLMNARKRLITSIRSQVKTFGERLPSCSVECFVNRTFELIPPALRPALEPLYTSLEVMSEQIKTFDREIERMRQERYPETEALTQVPGVGPLSSLSFVLTLESPERFAKSRQVGAYLGLVPRRDQSGETDKQLPITKAGDRSLRCLLVNCAQYILGPHGPDCELRRHGLRLAERGGKRAKKRAVIATARKLAVLLHRLWADQSVYEPEFSTMHKQKKAS